MPYYRRKSENNIKRILGNLKLKKGDKKCLFADIFDFNARKSIKIFLKRRSFYALVYKFLIIMR